jgi:hypothetical protein
MCIFRILGFLVLRLAFLFIALFTVLIVCSAVSTRRFDSGRSNVLQPGILCISREFAILLESKFCHVQCFGVNPVTATSGSGVTDSSFAILE